MSKEVKVFNFLIQCFIVTSQEMFIIVVYLKKYCTFEKILNSFYTCGVVWCFTLFTIVVVSIY